MVSFPEIEGLSFLFFMLFLVVAYYVFHVIKNAIIIAVISMAFPFVANAFFGMGFPTGITDIFQFASAGVGLYLLYEGLKWLARASKVAGHILGLIFWPFKAFLGFLKRLIFGKKK